MPENPALDSRALLGLLAKAHQVFATDGVTLSFPLGAPISYDATAFLDATGPAPDAAGHALLAEFSTMMNWVPDGPTWPPAEPRTLDGIVRTVVGQATWAVGVLDPEEEARAARAKALVDLANPVMQEYCARKDAWIRSQEQARNKPEDAAAQEAVKAAQLALVTCPGRDEIERAMQDLLALDDKAPYRAREQMQRLIDLGTGTFDDPSGGRFSPVRPLPREALIAPQWDTVTLDKAALESLAATAPAELVERLGGEPTTDGGVVSISFEYASARLHRPWLDDRLFELRCWRFDDAGRVLSDGGDPAAGECTSFVRAIVLARNVSVTIARPAQESSEPPPALDFLLPRKDRMALVREVIKRTRSHPEVEYAAPAVDGAALVEQAAPAPAAVLDVAGAERLTAAAQPRFSALRALADTSIAEDQPAQPVLAALDTSVLASAIAERADAEPARFQISAGLLQEAAIAPDFRYAFTPVEQAAPDPGPAQDPGVVTTTTAPGQLIVLALICRAVPKSPDPDPSFTWT